MPREMRPDLCGVLLGPRDHEGGKHLYVHVERERANAWRRDDVAHHIDLVRRNGIGVTVVIGERHVDLDPLPGKVFELSDFVGQLPMPGEVGK